MVAQQAFTTRSPLPVPVSVTVHGRIHRGCYSVRAGALVVEAFGLGVKSADASVLEGTLDQAAQNMAKLLLMALIEESASDSRPELTAADVASTSKISYDL